MNFNVIPDDFAPIEGGLVYRFDCGAVRPAIDVKIIDAATDEMQAVCRLTNTDFGSVDIAPYVRRMLHATPTAKHDDIITDKTRSVSVRLEIDGVSSAVRRYSLCPLGTSERLFTTMPVQREIAQGESDELTFYTPNGGFVTVTEYFDEDCSNYEYEFTPSNEVQILRVNADDFVSGTYAIDINIETGGRVDTVRYDFVRRPVGARRLKWLSSKGSIEACTFAVCRSQRLKIDKSRIYGADGYRTVGIQTERTMSLSSDYEPSDVIEALEELLYSEQVWIETAEVLEPVDVLSTENATVCNGGLNAIKIEVRPQRKGVRL